MRWILSLLTETLIGVIKSASQASLQKKAPIIVKFVRYNDRRNVFSNKKKSKDSGISVMESLTDRWMEELNKVRNEHGFNNV